MDGDSGRIEAGEGIPMKAILAIAAAATLSGCAYYDPYVYNSPYYGSAPGYYAPYAVPQPYYYGLPYGYGGYGYSYEPNLYPGYSHYPWVGSGPRVRPHPGTSGRDDGGSGHRRSRGGRGSSGTYDGGGSGYDPGAAGGHSGPTGGGSGYSPNQGPSR